MSKKIFKLKIKLNAAIFVLLALVASGFFIFGPDLVKMVQALSGNYNRTAADNELTRDAWNLLDDDFLARDGTGGMNADLNMGGNWITNINTGDPVNNGDVATKAYVDEKNADTSGSPLRMVCGNTPVTLTNCSQFGPSEQSIIRIGVSTPAFSATPVYFTSLVGGYSYSATGFNNVYPYVANDGFSIRIQYIGVERDGIAYDGEGYYGYLDCDFATAQSWVIYWCAVGS